MSDMDYIKLYRNLLAWEWYSDINTCRLFIHMLLKANWKEGNFRGTTVPRGSFVSSIGKLSEETQLTPDEVRTAIKHLMTTHEVTKQSYSKYTVFTVKNYDSYQNFPSKGTDKSHSIPKLFPTIEEKKEGKKEIIPPISPTGFNNFWEAYPKKVRILKAEEAYRQILFEDSSLEEKDVEVAACNYAEAVRIMETEDRYILNPENFLLKGVYADYLPGTYKKPQRTQRDKPSGQFNQFMQTDYDFEALEKELLGEGESNGL